MKEPNSRLQGTFSLIEYALVELDRGIGGQGVTAVEIAGGRAQGAEQRSGRTVRELP